MSIVPTKYGKMHIIDSDKVVSHALTLYGEWAMDELSLLSQIISPSMCVLDVGAFIGTHSLAFSKFVESTGQVYSFEPRKEIYAVLSENLSLNGCDNVTALNMGLDREQKTLDLQSMDVNELVNFGGLALDSDYCTADSVTYQIDISTIDSLGIKKIDIIKIDVEGMEGDVLNGAIETIARDRPIIFCECNSLNSGDEVLIFCQTRQYDTYGFLASAYNPDNFNSVKENIFGDAKELALLLIPQEKTAETLNKIANISLLPINSVEDLVLPLLHKPQYIHEVLVSTNTYSALGVNFPSPLSAERSEQINELSQFIAEQSKQIADFSQLIFDLSANFPTPLSTDRKQQVAELSHFIKEQNQQMAQCSQLLAERDAQIDTLQQWQTELRNEIEAFRLSTSWRITRPLRDISIWWAQMMRFVQIYQNHRQIYSGLDGIKRLISQYLDEKQKKNGAELSLNLLRTQLKKGLIANPTILFDHNGGGGSNIYTNELIKIIHADGGGVLRVYCFDAVWFVQLSSDGSLFSTSSIDELFEVLLLSLSKSVIINSLYGYPDIKAAIAHIINMVQSLDASLDYKVHDFYALCSSPHLSDLNDKYCGVPDDVEVCKNCLKKNLNWYHTWYPQENRPTDITTWRQPFAELFNVATTITLFDESSVDIMRKVFELTDAQIKVVPHVIKYFKCDTPIKIAESLHIGLLGTLSHIKGGHIVNALSQYLDEQNLVIPITVVGSSYMETQPSIHIYGEYSPNDLPIIVEKLGINVILMPSIVPETFSYTISEAMAMGLPIVAFDMGAQGHRVKQYALGKVVPPDASPAVILAAIQDALKVAQEKK